MLGFRITLVKDILAQHVTLASGICQRGIETAVYENGMILVITVPLLLYCHRSTERKFINIHGMENKREKACWAVMKLCG